MSRRTIANRPHGKQREWLQYKKDKCEICNSIYLLEMHHVNHNFRDNRESNLQTLCRSCHVTTHRKVMQLARDAVNLFVDMSKLSEKEIKELRWKVYFGSRPSP